jgi:FSR family fosmidomycin resistance protein-like MFS transporter
MRAASAANWGKFCVQTGDAAAVAASGAQRRTLAVASGAHILHDGYADLLYVLLPIWRAEFALDFAQVGFMRALFSGAMASFQVPAALLAERIGGRRLLALGSAVAAAGFVLAGISGGVVSLALALFIGGFGASAQHPIASGLVARAFDGSRSRTALGVYNFSGDLGKMVFPAATAGLLALMPWRPAVSALAAAGLTAAIAILLLLPPHPPRKDRAESAAKPPQSPGVQPATVAPGGFRLLLSIGVIDSATRMGFLTFLPFLLSAKGAGVTTIGVALTLTFAGGAAGKLVCAYLGARFGVLRTVYLTEGLTAAGILALLPLPLAAALPILPLIGVALNGTSSVLYGTVPELVPAERQERAFSLFYTGTIGSGAIAPILYGWCGDGLGVTNMLLLIAAVVLLTLPLAWRLDRALPRAAH